ncbi:ribonuclease H-like domain-containing protein [Mycena crocata]|nr:ribonuclease H-like domain-containing protein [Mycena crocata]
MDAIYISRTSDGVLGFDTEFVKRELSPIEKQVDEMVGLLEKHNKRSAVLGLQLMERSCAYPKELQRVLTSPSIAKVGVGLLSDIPVIWNDLRSELKNLVDCGMMARLLLAETYDVGGFQNLSMDVAASEILSCRIDKSLQVSNWRGTLTDAQIRYAGTDAVVGYRLYVALLGRLAAKSRGLGREIPVGWYSFDSRMGEPTRLKRTVRGEEVPWSTRDFKIAIYLRFGAAILLHILRVSATFVTHIGSVWKLLCSGVIMGLRDFEKSKTHQEHLDCSEYLSPSPLAARLFSSPPPLLSAENS